MKILAIDISGKVDKYDEALYHSIETHLSSTDSMVFACPYFSVNKNCRPLHLCSLVPSKYKNSSRIWKRLIKVIEGIINYLIVLHHVKKEPFNVLHLQWLPFLEFCSLEKVWLKLVHKIKPSIHIVLTMHNIFPHDSSKQKKIAYKKRVNNIIPYIDMWLVHTKDAAKQLQNEYNIAQSNISIIHHGVFVPNIAIPQRHRKDTKVRFLLFANQSYYKGTDIFIESIELLPFNIKEKIEAHIMGGTEKTLYHTYNERAAKENIFWQNHFIDDSELIQAIQDADVLVYPYRAITQSGALLLGMYFKKPMLISNLPAFIETLGEEYPKTLIFEAGKAKSLANAITTYIKNPIPNQKLTPIFEHLIDNNSWDYAAQKTLTLYHHLQFTK